MRFSWICGLVVSSIYCLAWAMPATANSLSKTPAACITSIQASFDSADSARFLELVDLDALLNQSITVFLDSLVLAATPISPDSPLISPDSPQNTVQAARPKTSPKTSPETPADMSLPMSLPAPLNALALLAQQAHTRAFVHKALLYESRRVLLQCLEEGSFSPSASQAIAQEKAIPPPFGWKELRVLKKAFARKVQRRSSIKAQKSEILHMPFVLIDHATGLSYTLEGIFTQTAPKTSADTSSEISADTSPETAVNTQVETRLVGLKNTAPLIQRVLKEYRIQ